jgi:hexosaminidase
VKEPGVAAQIRQSLILWRDNDAKLEPIIARSALLSGAQDASQTLTEVAKIGLEALDAIEAGQHLDSGWAAQAKSRLTAAARPVSEVRIGVVPAIQMLADATLQQ